LRTFLKLLFIFVQNKIFKAMVKANITFIKSVKSYGNGYSALYVMLRRGQNCKIRTKSGLQVPDKYWHEKSETHPANLAIPNIADIGTKSECEAINKQIIDIRQAIENALSSAEKSELNRDWLNKIIDKYHNPQKYERR
jgi:hypothetical protein